jgi:hypothetical protein
VTLFASGDSVTKARLVPVTEQALRLQGARVRDPIAHHVRLIEVVLREADQFDIFGNFQKCPLFRFRIPGESRLAG